MGQFEDIQEKAISVVSGNAAIFHLPPIESYPDPHASWYSSKGSVTYKINYVTTRDMLIILGATKEDEDSYR